jgi:uncharacterized protein (DUF58 family)
VLLPLLLAAALASDSMTLELSLPSQVRVGEPVELTLRATNHSPKSATLYLRGRPPAFDIIVTDTRGKVVWRRLRGATISMVLQVRELGPDESLTFEDKWDQRTNAGGAVRPGEYRVTGQLLTDADHPLETAPVSLRIIP